MSGALRIGEVACYGYEAGKKVYVGTWQEIRREKLRLMGPRYRSAVNRRKRPCQRRRNQNFRKVYRRR